MRNSLVRVFVFFAFTFWGFPQANTDLTLRKYLFSPQLLRRHQHELRLTEDQRRYIVQQVNEAQSEFTSMQWNLESEIRNLTNKVENRDSEESTLLEQLDIVLDLEKEIKRKQLIMAVRIRNSLNEEQLRILRDLRARIEQEKRPSRRGANPNPNRDNIP